VPRLACKLRRGSFQNSHYVGMNFSPFADERLPIPGMIGDQAPAPIAQSRILMAVSRQAHGKSSNQDSTFRSRPFPQPLVGTEMALGVRLVAPANSAPHPRLRTCACQRSIAIVNDLRQGVQTSTLLADSDQKARFVWSTEPIISAMVRARIDCFAQIPGDGFSYASPATNRDSLPEVLHGHRILRSAG